MTERIILLFGSILGCLLLLFILNAILNKRTKSRSQDNNNLLAENAVKAVVFITASILLSETVNTFQILNNVLQKGDGSAVFWQTQIMYFSFMLGVTLLMQMINIWISSIMFNVFSGGQSIFLEIANDSIRSSLLFAGILIALTLTTKPGLSLLLDKFIPYPSVANFH